MSEYNEVVGDLEAVDSNHPVLQSLKRQIDEANNRARNAQFSYNTLETRYNTLSNNIKNILTEALEDHDKDTILHIAKEIGIDLAVEKRYFVTVAFYVDTEQEVGVEFNPEWDLDFSVTSSTNSVEIIDFSSDIVSHNEE